MKQKDIQAIAEAHQPKTAYWKHRTMAFLVGGSIGGLAQLLTLWLVQEGMKDEIATTWIILGVIFISAILTGIGIYDRLAQKAGAGLFIPISGFANSLASEALESKSEGLILGIGSNMFKLAGSVLTYGIVAAILLSALKYGVMAG